MIIFTEVADTPKRVAHRVLGRADESYAKKIWSVNKNSFARQLMNDSGEFSKHRALWLPDFSLRDEDPFWIDHVIQRLDFIPSWGRYNLVKLQKRGVDINQLMGVGKSLRYHNRVHQDAGRGIIGSVAAGTAVESLTRGVERVSHPAEKFAESMHELNGHLAKLIQLRTSGHASHEALSTARQQFREAYQKTQKTLKTSAKFYANRVSKKTAKFNLSAKHMEFVAKKKGIAVSDLDDVRVISKIARYGKWAGRGCFAFSAALGVDEVYNSYEGGGDVWVTSSH